MEKLVPYLKQKSALKEIPFIDRHLHRPELKELFPADVKSMKRKRDEAIRAAYFEHGYRRKKIADFLGLHYTTLSNILKKTLK